MSPFFRVCERDWMIDNTTDLTMRLPSPTNFRHLIHVPPPPTQTTTAPLRPIPTAPKTLPISSLLFPSTTAKSTHSTRPRL
ncbi:hypothetical protein QJS04_geneDACA016192 [Acorus gramineus]|uniref:CRIB domain-containing protein n=1 Tax=Acorus gramineus TaxID=55184 RepID=A0AAV9B694_ACOGR|nr:hypothetical protein QJS04_geneDACA016192 [Acorus gramineus]